MTQTVLIADAGYEDAAADLAAEYRDLKVLCADDSSDALALASGDVAGLIAGAAAVDEALLSGLPSLRAVLKLGRSYHNIDVDAVRARRLEFACVPRKGPNCVAELAMTLILALSKDLVINNEAVSLGAYRYRGLKPEITAERKMAFHWMHNMRVHEVVGKTLGIIGMGEIGCELARRASVMGMRNLYYKRSPLSAELESLFDASYADLDALLAESDYICVATPHTPQTEGMIGAGQIALMKESAYIVNIARGGIIDEEAMIEALSENRIAGAGLDVFTYEPLPAESPLCALDNVILCPHIGGGTGTNRNIELGAGLAEMSRILAG
ncbi:MAG: bifunctional glyoxylate/hydroxypyruvate reductase B [Chloroflexi bacterium]|nr:bifunctional glyoxylate/hydroxypyruvate reductase B [Chloroflexota bacterium]